MLMMLADTGSGPAWTPAELWAGRVDPAGDWFKYDLTKIYSTVTAGPAYDGVTHASAVDDPVARWGGNVNGRRFLQSSSGNRPRLGVGGVRFAYDVTSRSLDTYYDGTVEYSVPRTIWIKAVIHAIGVEDIFGTVQTNDTLLTGFKFSQTLYARVRSTQTELGALTTGEHTLVIRTDQLTTGQAFVDDAAASAVAIGGNTTGNFFVANSKSGDFTILDCGIIYDTITDEEIALLKTYLDGVTA